MRTATRPILAALTVAVVPLLLISPAANADDRTAIDAQSSLATAADKGLEWSPSTPERGLNWAP